MQTAQIKNKASRQDRIKSKKLSRMAREIIELEESTLQKIGDEDADYINRVLDQSKRLSLWGKVLIGMSLDPVTWAFGTLLYAIHREIEVNFVGHHALHGAWDKLPRSRVNSQTYKLKSPVNKKWWIVSHNIYHHYFTNIAGQDPDLNHGQFRTSKLVPWNFLHVFQVIPFFLAPPVFLFASNLHLSGSLRFFSPSFKALNKNLFGGKDINIKNWLSNILIANQHTLRYIGRQYLQKPLRMGPLFPKFLLSYVIADSIAGMISFYGIFANHLGDDPKYFSKDFKTRNKAEWYRAQIESSQNFKISEALNVYIGYLNYQIEHHLFPAMPPNRYPEISSKLKAICKKYHIKYNNSRSWASTILNGMLRLIRFSIP